MANHKLPNHHWFVSFETPKQSRRGIGLHVKSASQYFDIAQALQVIASYSLADVSSSLSSQCWTFIRVIGQVNSRVGMASLSEG